MDFVANREEQLSEMLSEIGVDHFSDLIKDAIPSSLQCSAPVEDDGLSEFEGLQKMERLSQKNSTANLESYLGGGAYEHHVPALVGAVCSKSEFLTSYTPYQAEASQGTLQVTFEFQSAVCALTGMDVANAGVYDAASACAEAALMAVRSFRSKRKKVLVAASIHPNYYSVTHQYLLNKDLELVYIPFFNGQLDLDSLEESLDEETAAVLVQSPNFFGSLEDVASIVEKAKSVGALTILCSNPLSYGLFRTAGEFGVDIAVGDMQPFGLPLQFGGPYVGYMACTEKLVRQLPGRLVGKTIDTEEREGYVLTLQAREQHIRRDKATSNICTSQSLAALATLVGLFWYGKEGVKELALTNYQRAAYLKDLLLALPAVEQYGISSIFNEFTVRLNRPVSEILPLFREKGIEAGIPAARFFPGMTHELIIAVTETKSQEQLERYIMVAKEVLA